MQWILTDVVAGDLGPLPVLRVHLCSGDHLHVELHFRVQSRVAALELLHVRKVDTPGADHDRRRLAGPPHRWKDYVLNPGVGVFRVAKASPGANIQPHAGKLADESLDTVTRVVGQERRRLRVPRGQAMRLLEVHRRVNVVELEHQPDVSLFGLPRPTTAAFHGYVPGHPAPSRPAPRDTWAASRDNRTDGHSKRQCS